MHRFLRRLAAYIPYPHFMGLAPLDVLARLLLWPPAAVPPQYWLRLAALVGVSYLATIITLPERLALALWLRLRPPPLTKENAPIFVLGYFRSGTTFLQTLLAADPKLFSPRWATTLAPQGFVLTWTFLRVFLVPLLPMTRLRDVTPLEPRAPGEDDFALNNWTAASVLAGRAVLPKAQRFYSRFHDLDALTPAELSRWQRYQLAFVRKLLLISRGRRPLLKSPSHTARVDRLLAMFPGAKFVHISRPPMTVYRSNLHLVQTLQASFRLQDPLPAAEQDAMILDEYVSTERRYLKAKPHIPPGDVAEVRLQDLAADPIGEVERLYRELGLPFSRAFRENLRKRLAEAPPHNAADKPKLTEEQKRRATPLLAPLAAAFKHGLPTIRTVAPPPRESSDRWRPPIAAGVALAAACLYLAAWVGLAGVLGNRQHWLVWPAGLAIGYATLAAAGSGTARLGAWAAVLTTATLIAASLVNTWTISFGGQPGVSFVSLLSRTLADLDTVVSAFWAAMGLLTAYRVGSGARP